jgi:N-ethylmaleimide reductase
MYDESPQVDLLSQTLLSPAALGPYTLRIGLVMAPMTRSRAGSGGAPTALTATYYAQRASAGLIVTEGTQVSPQGVGYVDTPGIHSDAQVESWRRVTDAVHARGGLIFVQLWHVGRISHPDLQPDGALPVAPSAITPDGFTYTLEGQRPLETPRALDIAEIPGVVRQYAEAAEHARAAGFDGVELHGAYGYLIDQFLRDGTNHRTDAYGGSIGKRVRFLLEVTEAVANVWGADRVGVRLSPTSGYEGVEDSDPLRHFAYAAHALSSLEPAYLHVVAPDVIDPASLDRAVAVEIRRRFRGRVILNGGFDQDRAEEAVLSGLADLVSFGQLFLANPDLPERFSKRASLNIADRDTFYGGDARGYTDYPPLAAGEVTARRVPDEGSHS